MEPLTTAALVLGGAKLLGGAIEGFGQYQALAPSEVNQDRIAVDRDWETSYLLL